MPENFSIEVDADFIKKLFELADEKIPETPDSENLNAAIDKIKIKFEEAKSAVGMAMQEAAQAKAASVGTGAATTAESPQSPPEDDGERPNRVLVVDDLGIVTMQLESLFKKLGFEVTTSKELFDAIKKFKNQDFGYAVVDLFIPTDREGFILIDEIKKLSLLCKLNTKIIVMSASGKKEHKEKCITKGAHIFIEKNQGWQDKIVDYVTGKTSS